MDSRIIGFLRLPWVIPTAVGVVSLGGGFAAGYKYKERKGILVEKISMEAVIEEEEDPQQTLPFKATVADFERINRDYLSSVHPEAGISPGNVISITDPRPDPSDIQVEQEDLGPDVPNPQPSLEIKVDSQGPVNIFAGGVDGWDYDEELQLRTPHKPYIIHKDEFFNQEFEGDQNTLTYYSQDDIMADDSDTPVYGYEKLVGTLQFGHGSGDPNVVYVRNEDRKCEYEILFDPGSFSTEILGIYAENATREDEIRHSRNLMKFPLE